MNSTVTDLREKIFAKFKKDSWEVKTLGEIATEIISGSEITKEQLGTGNYPAIRFKQIHDSQITIKNFCSFVNPGLIKNKKYAENGDILIATTSNVKENSGKSCVYLGNEKCLIGNDVKIIKHNQNPKYLSYFLSSFSAKKQFIKLSQNSTVFHLYTKDIKQIKIPLPPLEIQHQIAEFLDKFLELKKRLREEIERREIQYQHYKNLIFNRGIEKFGWELKTIEEIATEIISGNDVRKDQVNTGKCPAIRYKDIHDSEISLKKCINFVDPSIIKNAKYVETNYLLIAKVSENIEDSAKACVYLGGERAIIGGGAYAIKHNQNPKYMSYAFSSNFVKEQIKNLSRESVVINFPKSSLEKLQIPLPSLEEQDKVVEQLDKLFKIVNDLNDGIPMMIEKNKQQYNFYKELLLEK